MDHKTMVCQGEYGETGYAYSPEDGIYHVYAGEDHSIVRPCETEAEAYFQASCYFARYYSQYRSNILGQCVYEYLKELVSTYNIDHDGVYFITASASKLARLSGDDLYIRRPQDNDWLLIHTFPTIKEQEV